MSRGGWGILAHFASTLVWTETRTDQTRSLLEKIGAPPVLTGGQCGVLRAATGLSDDDRADLYAMVDDPRWPYVTLARKLREAGVHVSEKAIRKHRLRDCLCEPTEVAS